MGTDETQRLVRPLVIPPPMLPCATAPPHSPWRARLQPPLPHTPLGSHSSPTPAARQLPMVYRMGAAPGLIALGWGGGRIAVELARCNQQVRARRDRGAAAVERATPAVLRCRAAHGPGRRVGRRPRRARTWMASQEEAVSYCF